jgi:hypothetical protein
MILVIFKLLEIISTGKIRTRFNGAREILCATSHQ